MKLKMLSKRVCSIEGCRLFSMYIFVLGLLLALSSCFRNEKTTQMKRETLFEVHFQDFFKGDRAGLKFNDCDVFDDVELYSDSSIGLTKVRVQIFKETGHKFFIHYLDKTIKCKSPSDTLKLSVMINGNRHQYLIDLSKGKYIGFSKKSREELYFYQSLLPFEYD